ncbi:MAG: WhiB family transcriptional regulator [Acidimicrobiia bacterium]|jgi:WhiB family redox-sensing transcriptional regulator
MYAIQLETTQDTEDPWRVDARCRDGAASLTDLFFSEDLGDIARAKSFCAGCPVRTECLTSAMARHEPWGVWGGELFVNGRVVANKRRRGRPPKVARPEPILHWEIAVAEIA